MVRVLVPVFTRSGCIHTAESNACTRTDSILHLGKVIRALVVPNLGGLPEVVEHRLCTGGMAFRPDTDCRWPVGRDDADLVPEDELGDLGPVKSSVVSDLSIGGARIEFAAVAGDLP